MSQTFTNISVSYVGLSFNVSGTYTPSTPDVWTLPNGDPGYPGDPAEAQLDIIEWIQDNGTVVDVTELVERLGELYNFETAFLEQFQPEYEHGQDSVLR